MKLGDIEVAVGGPLPVPVFDQGARPVCAALATTSSHERARRDAEPLSPEAIWQHAFALGHADASGSTLDAMSHALSDIGQPTLTDWPFSPLVTGPQAVPTAAGTPPWRQAKLIKLAPTVQEIERVLRDGDAPVVGIRLTGAFFTVGSSGVLPPFAKNEPNLGGHALVAVALGQHPAGGAAIAFRNSWGESWGASGHAWAHAVTLETRLLAVARLHPR